MKQAAAWIGGAVLLVLAVVWVRVALSARAELEEGRSAEQAADVEGALMHYQRALRWYTPLASAPGEAADRLWAIGEAARTRGDRAGALAAFRRLRGGILATRNLWSPFGERLPAVNQALAELMADEQVGQPSARGRDRATLLAWHAQLLALDPTPAPGWALWVVLSFFGWIGGVAGLIFRGLDREARLQRGPALRWGGLAAGCFALWVVGLYYA